MIIRYFQCKYLTVVGSMLGALLCFGCSQAVQENDSTQQQILQSDSDLLAGTHIAIAYSGFRKGQHPDRGDGAINPSDDEILEDLEILAKNSTFPLIRVYDSDENSEAVLRLIKDHNIDIKVMLGIWISAEISNHEGCPWLNEPIPPSTLIANKAKNEAQLEKGIRLANSYSNIVIAVNVGNEALADFTNHMVSVESLIAYVRKVKKAVHQPVTVAEYYSWWLENGILLAPELDFVAVQIHPIWENIPIDDALAYTDSRIRTIKDSLGGAQIVITETAWATTASEFPDQASEENQLQYYNEFTQWAKQNNVTTFIFEAFDEPWKGDSANPDGAEKHWGLFTEQRNAKMAMHKLYPERIPTSK
jgi:exo-beta-1,3-glucanase (GH17 family)